MRIAFYVVFFLLFGAFFIITENNLALAKSGNITSLGDYYFKWVSGIFDNVMNIGGYVVKADWVPRNLSG